MIELLNSDTVLSKVIIAIFSSIITITINKLIDLFKENKRLNEVKNSFRSLINDSVILTLMDQRDNYIKLENGIKSGNILDGLSISQYPWLKSDIMNFVSKNDLFKIFNKIDNDEISKTYRKFVELDYLNENSPYQMYLKFDTFIKNHFSEKNLKNKHDKIIHYQSGCCPEIEAYKELYIRNIKKRLNQTDELVEKFALINELLK